MKRSQRNKSKTIFFLSLLTLAVSLNSGFAEERSLFRESAQEVAEGRLNNQFTVISGSYGYEFTPLKDSMVEAVGLLSIGGPYNVRLYDSTDNILVDETINARKVHGGDKWVYQRLGETSNTGKPIPVYAGETYTIAVYFDQDAPLDGYYSKVFDYPIVPASEAGIAVINRPVVSVEQQRRPLFGLDDPPLVVGIPDVVLTDDIQHHPLHEQLSYEQTWVQKEQFGVSGSDNKSSAQATAVDDEGNIYIVGNFRGTMDANPAPDGEPDVHGNYPGVDLVEVSAPGKNAAYITRINADGSYAWTKVIQGKTTKDINDGSAFTSDIDVFGNSLYVTGDFRGTVDLNPGGEEKLVVANGEYDVHHDVYVVRLSLNGNFEWGQAFGGDLHDHGRGIAATENGIYIVGEFRTTGNVKVDLGGGQSNGAIGQGGSDLFVTHFTHSEINDFENTYKWHYAKGSAQNDGAYDVAVDQYGFIYFTGAFKDTVDFGVNGISAPAISIGREDLFIARIEGDKERVWVESSGTLEVTEDNTTYSSLTDIGHAIAVRGRNVYVAGTAEARFTNSEGVTSKHDDAVVIAYETTGLGFIPEYKWTKQFGGNASDRAYSIAVTDRHVAVTGSFRDSATFGDKTLTSKGNQDIFYTLMSQSDGSFVDTYQVGSSTHDSGLDITAMKDGFIVAGQINSGGQKIVDFDPTETGEDRIQTEYKYDGFVSKWRYNEAFEPLYTKVFSYNDVHLCDGIFHPYWFLLNDSIEFLRDDLGVTSSCSSTGQDGSLVFDNYACSVFDRGPDQKEINIHRVTIDDLSSVISHSGYFELASLNRYIQTPPVRGSAVCTN